MSAGKLAVTCSISLEYVIGKKLLFRFVSSGWSVTPCSNFDETGRLKAWRPQLIEWQASQKQYKSSHTLQIESPDALNKDWQLSHFWLWDFSIKSLEIAFCFCFLVAQLFCFLWRKNCHARKIPQRLPTRELHNPRSWFDLQNFRALYAGDIGQCF